MVGNFVKTVESMYFFFLIYIIHTYCNQKYCHIFVDDFRFFFLSKTAMHHNSIELFKLYNDRPLRLNFS